MRYTVLCYKRQPGHFILTGQSDDFATESDAISYILKVQTSETELTDAHFFRIRVID